MQEKIETPRWVSVKAACRIAGCGPTTMYKILNEGVVEAVKLGTRTLVSVQSLDAHLKSLPPFSKGGTNV